MPVSQHYSPAPRFPALGPEFSDSVAPADFPRHHVRWRNQAWAERVGLGALSDAEWIAHFGTFKPLPNNIPTPLAMRYHGHQFQTYNPNLGDGRGFLFAQLRDDRGRLLDLATKGSGQTPWSRQGDGRLTLKGGVREVLAAAMLAAQGVYTSKAFSLIETGEQLARNDEPSPTRSAVLTRLSHSHIRFGTFQRHAFLGATDNLRALVDHCIENYWPEHSALDGEARVAGLVRSVSIASAELCASWMAAGFVHGVLNTDNMVITGESFDYGPWRFLPEANPNFTAAYFDHNGLYAYGRQPHAVFWNLKQLAGALTSLCDKDALVDAISAYPPAVARAQREKLCARLGVCSQGSEADGAMLDAFFAFMGRTKAPWDSVFHDWFGGNASEQRAANAPNAALYETEEAKTWLSLFRTYEPDRPVRLAHPYFQRQTPVSLVIEEVEAVWAPIAEADDWSRFQSTLADLASLQEALSLANP